MLISFKFIINLKFLTCEKPSESNVHSVYGLLLRFIVAVTLPHKICPNCSDSVPVAKLVCDNCGNVFISRRHVMKSKIKAKSFVRASESYSEALKHKENDKLQRAACRVQESVEETNHRRLSDRLHKIAVRAQHSGVQKDNRRLSDTLQRKRLELNSQMHRKTLTD